MTAPTASVVVVSRGRPHALSRLMRALRQLDHPAFEVIVAADAPGRAAIRAAGLAGQVKMVAVDAPGIGAARNAGLAAAAGEIVAFIDDDAIPEPTWLTHLAGALAAGPAVAAGGFVRGANGISWQWRARSIDAVLCHRAIPAAGNEPFHPVPGPGHAIRTEGTNMAFRREPLIALGGFDAAFRYYLDETDLNMRLHRAGKATVIVPRAEVHHAMAASALRGPDRAPRSLFEIGASVAVFLRRHTPAPERARALATARGEARRHLLRHLVRGGLEPRDIAILTDSFEAGLHAGRARPGRLLSAAEPPPFLPFPGAPGRAHLLLTGRIWQAARLRRAAAGLAAEGNPVTLFLFAHSARAHRMRYRDDGVWEQAGGLWGRAVRESTAPPAWSFGARVAAEARRLAPVRTLSAVAGLCPVGRNGAQW